MTQLRIHLRDIRPDLVDAWRAICGDLPGIEISCGDIFDASADAVVSPANSFGFMDGGIDLVYSRRFGWGLQNRLQEVIRDEFDGELPVGLATVVATGDATMPWCVSAPTMRVPMDVADTMNAYLAFRAALIAVRRHNESSDRPIRTLLCPGLGTAIGKMPAVRCARQMRAAYVAIQLGNRADPHNLARAQHLHERMS